MSIRTYRPTSPSRRNMTNLTFEEITKSTPEKSLTVKLSKTGGRNNGTVKAVEYDPNRNANILLVFYADGEKRYILAPSGVKVGDKVVSGENVDIKVGNALPLKNIPEGTFVHNIELSPKKGGQMCRAAGTSAQVLGSESGHVILRLASGEVRKVLEDCRATVGVVGNEDFALVNKGKAGKTRYQGIRPTVRGSAMNPVDHPHGGGEGKCPVGRDAPRSPWGKRCQGVKTRHMKKNSTRLIVRRASKK